MNNAPPIGAVVLAAGRSSRMGRCKALLPLGGEVVEPKNVDGQTKWERVEGPEYPAPTLAATVTHTHTALSWAVRGLRLAGVCELVVVTGHEQAVLAPLLDCLSLREARNPRYDLGMFSSVQAGVAALSPNLQGAFVLPVDFPLVRSETLRSLLERSRSDAILHPTCCGRRGHPPLVGADHFSALLDAPSTSTLRDFFAQHEEAEIEVEVEDPFILLDMDTPEDFRLVSRLASFAASDWVQAGIPPADDAPAKKGTGDATLPRSEAVSLDYEDCLALLKALGPPPNVIQHSLVVADVGRWLAQAVASRVGSIDPAQVVAACLLHDMVRSQPSHALLAGRLLANLGLKRLAPLVAGHMVLDPDLSLEPGLTETELLYLADKVVFEAEIVGLAERERRSLLKTESSSKCGPEAQRRVRERMDAARRVAAKVEALVGQPLNGLLEQIQAHRSIHR